MTIDKISTITFLIGYFVVILLFSPTEPPVFVGLTIINVGLLMAIGWGFLISKRREMEKC